MRPQQLAELFKTAILCSGGGTADAADFGKLFKNWKVNTEHQDEKSLE